VNPQKNALNSLRAERNFPAPSSGSNQALCLWCGALCLRMCACMSELLHLSPEKATAPNGPSTCSFICRMGGCACQGPSILAKMHSPQPAFLQYNTMLCYAMLCYAVPHYNILYCTTLYYTVPYYTTLYHAIPHYTYCLVRLHCTLQYLTLHTEYTSVKYTWAQGWRFPGASKNLVFRCKKVGGGLWRA